MDGVARGDEEDGVERCWLFFVVWLYGGLLGGRKCHEYLLPSNLTRLISLPVNYLTPTIPYSYTVYVCILSCGSTARTTTEERPQLERLDSLCRR
jgi:hypothetical protein